MIIAHLFCVGFIGFPYLENDTTMFGLIADLDDSKWSEGDASDRADFQTYTILRTEFVGEGVFRYFVSADSGSQKHVILIGARSDPLKSVRVAEMRIAGDETVTGLILEDDCVLYNEL